MLTKTRKQGNSIMLTVPKEFNIPTGVDVEAKLVENGILYEFVEPKKEFFDFSEDILADIIAEGYDTKDMLTEFKRRKQELTSAFRTIAKDTVENAKPMSKEKLAAQIGL